MSFHRGTDFRKEDFPELKLYGLGKFFQGCGGGNAGEIAVGMRAPDGHHVRVKADQNRPPPDQPIDG
jgi:hypothetical protein